MMTASFSCRRLFLVAHQTGIAAIRQRALHVLVAVTAMVVWGTYGLRRFDFGADETKFVVDCGSGAMSLFGAAWVIAATAQLFGGEIESGTALIWLAKPLRRSEFVLGKFVAIAALAAVFCVVITMVIAVLLGIRIAEGSEGLAWANRAGGSADLADLVALGVSQWLRLVVLAAMTQLVAAFSQSQFFTISGATVILAIGHLRALPENAARYGATTIVRLFGHGVMAAIPDFSRFDVGADGGHAPSGDVMSRLGGYALVYVAAGCALTMYRFRRREL